MNPLAIQLAALLSALLIASMLHAETASTDPVPLLPNHKGYAVDRPQVLVQQRLFGLAHGVRLLASTCRSEAGYREAVDTAYGEWERQQAATVTSITRDLSRYYFDSRAEQASPQDVARALNLVSELDLKPGSKAFNAACDTLATALTHPRYNLQQQYLLQSYASRLAVATAIEAEAEVCRAELSESVQGQLDQAMALWHQAYDDKTEAARSLLRQQWPNAEIEGTFEDWLAQARANGKRRRHALGEAISSDPVPCAAMPSWLLTLQADPDDEFKPNS